MLRRILVLMCLLRVSVAALNFHVLEQSAHPNVTYGLPVVLRYDSVQSFKPTLVGARPLRLTGDLGTCSDLYVDLPLGRRWPPNMTQPLPPASIQFVLWSMNRLSGSWLRTQQQMTSTWTFTVPMNGTWDPPRTQGLYRFHLNATMLGGLNYTLGVVINQAGTQNLGQTIFWAGTDPAADNYTANLPVVGQFVDVWANSIDNSAIAAQQSLWGDMPRNTDFYVYTDNTNVTGFTISSLAWNIVAQCSSISLDFGSYLPRPNWIYDNIGPSWPTSMMPPSVPSSSALASSASTATWMGLPSFGTFAAPPPGTPFPSGPSSALPPGVSLAAVTPTPVSVSSGASLLSPTPVPTALSPTEQAQGVPDTTSPVAPVSITMIVSIFIGVVLFCILSVAGYLIFRRIRQIRRPIRETTLYAHNVGNEKPQGGVQLEVFTEPPTHVPNSPAPRTKKVRKVNADGMEEEVYEEVELQTGGYHDDEQFDDAADDDDEYNAKGKTTPGSRPKATDFVPLNQEIEEI